MDAIFAGPAHPFFAGVLDPRATRSAPKRARNDSIPSRPATEGFLDLRERYSQPLNLRRRIEQRRRHAHTSAGRNASAVNGEDAVLVEQRLRDRDVVGSGNTPSE